MKLSFKDIFKTALPLVLICVVISASLGLTNELTKGPIAQLAQEKEMAARQEVLPQAVAFEAIEGMDSEFINYAAFDAYGKKIGYVITTAASGYGGKVQIMTGITTDGSVSGVSVLSQSETVGLGANCEKESFRDQFVGKIPQNGYVVYKNGSASVDGGIQAMTSATITTSAVVSAVNSAVNIYKTIAKEGK